MPTITIFRHKNQVCAQRPLLTILQQIKRGMYKEIVQDLREQKLLELKDLDEYLLDHLPAFTPSGKFEGGRDLDSLMDYSQYIWLEVAGLDQDLLASIKMDIARIPFTYACFINQLGEGLVVLVKVKTPALLHTGAFACINQFYRQRLALDTTLSGQHIGDLCPYSYDPDIYINPDAALFPVKLQPTGTPPSLSGVSSVMAMAMVMG